MRRLGLRSVPMLPRVDRWWKRRGLFEQGRLDRICRRSRTFARLAKMFTAFRTSEPEASIVLWSWTMVTEKNHARALRYRELALAEADNDKAGLLNRLADEAERGLLYTTRRLSRLPAVLKP
jgi:hypothetical protein